MNALFGREPDRKSGSDRVAYALESPKYHRLRFDQANRYAGWLFWYGPRVIRTLHVRQDGLPSGVFPVNLQRNDIFHYVQEVPGAARCGFEFDLHVPAAAKAIELLMEFDDGAVEPFVVYDVACAWTNRHELSRMAHIVDSVPVPEPDLVLLTQPTPSVQEYADSAVSGVMNLVAYLQRGNGDLATVRSILDFGCGSGRLLVGWRAHDPTRRLYGCDLNPALTGWAEKHLSKEIAIHMNNLHPPLPYPDHAFDLVYLVSVFTHLSLESQRRWVKEFHRIIRPGGLLLVTLHGESYVYYVFRDDEKQVRAFHRRGYLELGGRREGSNELGTFHTRGVVRDIFQGFDLCAFFPNGCIDDHRPLFPLAMMQDVYVFRR